jgi:hypothetical protein
MSIQEGKSQRWFDEQGLLHRENGPAVEYADGGGEWWIHGHRQTKNGQSTIVTPCGTQIWVIDDQLHRDQEPAIIGVANRQEWWVHGHRSRENNQPAIEDSGRKEWWVNDIYHGFNDDRHRDDEYITMNVFKHGGMIIIEDYMGVLDDNFVSQVSQAMNGAVSNPRRLTFPRGHNLWSTEYIFDTNGVRVFEQLVMILIKPFKWPIHYQSCSDNGELIYFHLFQRLHHPTQTQQPTQTHV